MIARLEGVLLELSPTRVVVDVRGVGYEVLIPLSTFTQLPNLGKTVVLHIYTHAPEGSLQLFGFASRGERVAFDLLLRANRVGPRLAQTILSGISPPDLLAAIHRSDVAVLRSAPGVGSKLAERILVDLRDRTAELAAAVGGVSAGASAPAAEVAEALQEQTLSALVNLGYPKSQAERALAGAVDASGDAPTLEDLVRGSLKMLVKS
ncbi:MAG: Holliday junction branch migration protein RuvA [Deltaproteobacteria bacterium]|nr:Holliday junction branch migration protein RuvA [Deltaproteobacteria bacterium]MBW2664655.1 Holliday junction branch migration protein RuvA [Deltaproteobacteria bacterium]